MLHNMYAILSILAGGYFHITLAGILVLIQYASEFFELGEARTGVYNLLVTHACSMWQKRFLESGPEAVLQSLETHQELIMQACLFGP